MEYLPLLMLNDAFYPLICLFEEKFSNLDAALSLLVLVFLQSSGAELSLVKCLNKMFLVKRKSLSIYVSLLTRIVMPTNIVQTRRFFSDNQFKDVISITS